MHEHAAIDTVFNKFGGEILSRSPGCYKTASFEDDQCEKNLVLLAALQG